MFDKLTVVAYCVNIMGAHHHHHDHEHHGISNTKRLGLVIFFNIVITLAEYIGGILSGSLALISDAGHNLSDVLSLILSYAGEKVSARKPDSKYSFGMKRFEVLIALINALSLLAIGIYIVYEAIQRFMHPQPIQVWIMLPVAVIGLLGNVFSILVISRKRSSNLNMKAAFLHLFYDAISSVAVIAVGLALLFTNLYWLDLVVSLVIVFMIVWSSLGILRQSLRIFMQGTPSDIDRDQVHQSILSINHVKSVHGLHIWSVSSSEIFLSCHICIGGDPQVITGDEVIKDINAILKKDFGIEHTTLQIEHNRICDPDSGVCCR
ncbi:cation diffusion facilitator family transporter [Candidatus Margulisiibacteriota bacterium]